MISNVATRPGTNRPTWPHRNVATRRREEREAREHFCPWVKTHGYRRRSLRDQKYPLFSGSQMEQKRDKPPSGGGVDYARDRVGPANRSFLAFGKCRRV